ncbi:hypothetical protein ACLOJK_031083 [Asimina triloba]
MRQGTHLSTVPCEKDAFGNPRGTYNRSSICHLQYMDGTVAVPRVPSRTAGCWPADVKSQTAWIASITAIQVPYTRGAVSRATARGRGIVLRTQNGRREVVDRDRGERNRRTTPLILEGRI